MKRPSGPTYVVPVVVGHLQLPIRAFRGYAQRRLTRLDGELDTLHGADGTLARLWNG